MRDAWDSIHRARSREFCVLLLRACSSCFGFPALPMPRFDPTSHNAHGRQGWTIAAYPLGTESLISSWAAAFLSRRTASANATRRALLSPPDLADNGRVFFQTLGRDATLCSRDPCCHASCPSQIPSHPLYQDARFLHERMQQDSPIALAECRRHRLMLAFENKRCPTPPICSLSRPPCPSQARHSPPHSYQVPRLDLA